MNTSELLPLSEIDSHLKDYLFNVANFIYLKFKPKEDLLVFSNNLNIIFKTDIFPKFFESDLKLLEKKEVDIFELSLSYEVYKDDNKKLGRFYTPLNLVKEMSSPIKFNPDFFKVLDPACGTGIFLLTLLEKIKSEFISKKELFNFVEKNFYFVDLDHTSLELSRIFLLILIFDNIEELERTDLLLDNAINDNFLLSQNKFLDQKFDVIIGNPPYGLSRNEQIEKDELDKLNLKYKSFFKAKLNKYLMFLYSAYLKLNNKGVLIFVVPNAWLGIRSAKSFREFLFEKKALSFLNIYKKRVFPKASVEAVVVGLSNDSTKESVLIENKLKPYGEVISKNLYKYLDFSKSQDFMIPTRWSATATEVFSIIDNSTIPVRDLKKLFKPLIALQAYSTGKGVPAQSSKVVKEHSFHSETKVDDSYLPYLNGKDIKRFSYNYSNFLKYGIHLAEPQTIDRYTGARIVLREILGKAPYYFQATVIEEVALYNKSCLHILLVDKKEVDSLYALCALLNSKLGSFILHYKGRKSQRATFPKIVNDDLLNFPYPVLTIDDKLKLKNCYLKLAEDSNCEKTQNELDMLVYKIYQVEDYLEKIESILC